MKGGPTMKTLSTKKLAETLEIKRKEYTQEDQEI